VFPIILLNTMAKKQKEKIDDPGISFTNMNAPGMPGGYTPRAGDKEKNSQKGQKKISAREKRKLIRQSFARFLLPLVATLVGFGLMFLLLMWWLS